MIDFSLDIKNALLGRGNIVEICHQKYLSGDRSAIMTVLIVSSFYEKPIPDWAADELLTLDTQIANGQFRDLNEFFNFGKPGHKTTLKRLSNIKTKNIEVVRYLYYHKVNGGDFSRNELRDIAAELGVSQEEMETIFNDNKCLLEETPRKGQANTVFFQSVFLSLLELVKFKRSEREK